MIVNRTDSDNNAKFAARPSVNWDDVLGTHQTREELEKQLDSEAKEAASKSPLFKALSMGVMLTFTAIAAMSCFPDYADAATAKTWKSTARQAITAFENALPDDKSGIQKCKAIVGKFDDGKAHTTIHNVNPYVKLMVFTGASKGYGYGCVAYPVNPN